jgi:hypothetical protein
MRNLNYYLKYIFIFLSKTKLNIFLTIALIIAIYFYLSNPSKNKYADDQIFTLKSKCNCRKDLNIKKINNSYYFVDKKYSINSYIEDKTGSSSSVDNLKYDDYVKNYKHTCGLYNVLRRGPNQHVIGFSIYGSNVNYYKPLLILADAIKKYFPGWSIRVHHSSALAQSVACEFECKEDIIDFCNVDELPFEFNKTLTSYKASSPHAMMWRWYPIADDFVDYFMSRDSDSVTIQREKDSVDVWLFNRTNTLFHVMRDNPYHNIHILGMFFLPFFFRF